MARRTCEQLQAEALDGVLVEVDLRAQLLELLAQDAVALLEDLQLAHLEVLALADHLLALWRHLPRYTRIMDEYVSMHNARKYSYTIRIGPRGVEPYTIELLDTRSDRSRKACCCGGICQSTEQR